NIIIAEYPLNVDKVYVIDEHNSIEIKKKRVRMLDSDCPDKRCVKQGFTNSLPIICLPNRLVVEIRKHKQNKALILQ
ncbi:MAG TPA: NusG domain II-containing protein, partial [Candidatus Cloacimonadota bacterium]|nr:NusG domain II-containing protein [Candidatus Cloacimonadota bacterium]